jgi:hypothetical protein
MPKCHFCGETNEFVEPCEKFLEPHCVLCCIELSEKEAQQSSNFAKKAAEASALFLIPLISQL